jgi:hypothetical protein
MDRVAFDERPDELSSIAHRRTRPELHLAEVDRWGEAGPGEPPKRRGPDDRDGGGSRDSGGNPSGRRP